MTLRSYPIYMVLAAAAIARAAAPEDPAGWTAAKWGMSVMEVRAAIPDARQLDPAADPKVDKRPSALVIPKVEIGKRTWSVYFQFDLSGKLDAVHLQADLVGSTSTGFVDTELMLAEKYGRPFERKEDSNRAAQWKFPATHIELRYVNLPAIRFETLWLSYTKPAPARL